MRFGPETRTIVPFWLSVAWVFGTIDYLIAFTSQAAIVVRIFQKKLCIRVVDIWVDGVLRNKHLPLTSSIRF